MCTAALPQFGNLKVTKEELDDWYAWFYGEDIAGRKPPPSDTTLLFAERNAWRKIHEMVHALKNIRGDFLFWQREVYEHQEQGQGTQGVADSVGEAQEGRERFLALGADPVQAEGQGRQGEVPQHPLGSVAGPLGFQEFQRGGVLQRITSTTSVRDHAADPRTARSGRMGGCAMPPQRSMCHRHALTFPSDRRPLRVP